MSDSTRSGPEPTDLVYEADLLGNIQQALAGLQGFDVMALELIQNADDARATSLTFDVLDDALVVRNDGTFSTCGLHNKRCPWDIGGDPDGLVRPCNFHAISRMGSRSKIHASAQIGRFGIGFVSVYQITDAPIIRSSGIEMRLEPISGRAPTRSIADRGGTEVELPWAATASLTRKALNASPTPDDVAALLLDAVSNVMTQGLIFLRHLRKFRLLRNGALHRSVEIVREGGLVRMAIQPEGRIEGWKVLVRDAAELAAERSLYKDYPTLSELDRSTRVQVAVPLDGEAIKGLLFAYLPTEQPSGMPVHVNGDFFPHPNRRSIVLTGEQHERYWNELLLDTAAAALADAFLELRDLLGAVQLWALATAAFAIRETRGFAAFWERFAETAREVESVHIVDGSWRTPSSCRLPPDAMLEAEQLALAALGVNLILPALRPAWTVLSATGVTPLRLTDVVNALAADAGAFGFNAGNARLPALWSAIDQMIEISRDRTGFAEIVKRLSAVPFLIGSDGKSATVNALWQTEPAVDPAAVAAFVEGCPLVHSKVTGHAAITSLIDVYRFDDLANDLAKLIKDADIAKLVLGQDAAAAKTFYGLLTSFDVNPSATSADVTLADVPMLWAREGWISPSRGQLPGGFADPVGHFELIDTAPMDERMTRLASDVLGVRGITFKDYVEDHLEDILEGKPERGQYVSLLIEIVGHTAELDAEGALKPLSGRSFVRTRAGTYARPDECYYWSAALEQLLGDDPANWVEPAWMPADRDGARLQDLLEVRLGMRKTVSIRHLVARVTEIAEQESLDQIVERTTPIVRDVLDRWPRLSPSDRQELAKLGKVAFLPAAIDGVRVAHTRYPPSIVYRAVRASGFWSQVPIVDLQPLRRAEATVAEFLELLGMPSEPPTEKIVAHLEHCMTTKAPVNDVTYAMLSERLTAPDAACIDRLVGKAFIYVKESEEFLHASCVFWIPPPFGGRWHAASQGMRIREPLYRRLGVTDQPGPKHYAAMLTDIAGMAEPTPEDATLHARCLARLADALDRGEAGADEAVDGLVGEFALLNLNGGPVWAEDAVWVDSNLLIAPFGDVLNDRLVAQPAVSRGAATRLFRHLDVVAVSQVTRLKLAVRPDNAPALHITDRLRERSDLLLWLSPNSDFREGLRRLIDRIEIYMTERLLVYSEITAFDPPVPSPVVSAASFLDEQTDVLHVRAAASGSMDWPSAFRALFARLERHTNGVEMPPIVMAAALVAIAPTWEDAEQALLQSDYRAPVNHGADLPRGEALGDAEDEPEEEDVSDGGDKLDQPGETDHDGVPEDADEDVDALNGGDEDAVVYGRREEGRSGKHPSNGAGGGGPGASGGRGADGGASASGRASGAPGAEGGSDEDKPFGSKPDEGPFGAEPHPPGGAQSAPASAGPGSAPSSGRQGTLGSRSGATGAERQARMSRMLAYVASSSRTADGSGRTGDDHNISEQIDVAAIAAALKYEQARGWSPVEQPHGNPGYDIVSTPTTGSGRRLIEVKGLENDWTERGIKLSHVQYGMAESHPDEFWIYVVENARDRQRQRVTAIANPFSKVVEYWFDDRWREVSEERATSSMINVQIGTLVRHAIWGVGTIVEIKPGTVPFLTIDFGTIEGRRGIPYTSALAFVD